MPAHRISGFIQRTSAARVAPMARLRAPATAPTGYQRLFEVAIEHGYDAGTERGNFDVYPNGRSQALMDRLALVFRPSSSGFSVLYNADRAADLASYLRGPVIPRAPRWTYLSFFLAPRTPRIFNVTEMPLDLHPFTRNFYFANGGVDRAWAHEDPTGAIVLGESPQAVSTADLLPVRPARFDVIIPEGGKAVLKNAAGVVQQSIDFGDFQRNLDLLSHPEESGLSTAELDDLRRSLEPSFFSTPERSGTYGGQVDLARHYEGLYHLEVIGKDGELMTTGKDETPMRGSGTFVYTISTPAPLCFMHILLCQPGPAIAGFYPVAPGDAPGEEEYVFRRYVLRFSARRTRWMYHVVPRRGLTFRDLKIQSAPGSDQELLFSARGGGAPRRLPNGADGYTFVSQRSLPLLRRSGVRLQLRGARADVGEERVLLEPLPVPGADQTPVDAGGDEPISEIYVHV